MQVIKFKKLHEDAQLPVYSTEGAGGFGCRHCNYLSHGKIEEKYE